MKHPKLLPFMLALFGLLLGPASLFAQTGPYSTDQTAVEDEDTYVLPTFTVENETVDRYRAADAVSAVRIRTSLIETPATISVLTREFLEDVAPVRILDATRYSAGIQAGYHFAFADTMTMRGFDISGRTIDNFLDVGAWLVESALIERIEVSKGPNAILAPGVSPGGQVNIVSKSPQFERSSSISGTFGEWNANKYTLDATGPLDAAGRFAYRVVGVYQDSRGYWSKDYVRDRQMIAPSLTWRITPTTEFTLRSYHYEALETRHIQGIIDSSVTRRGQKPIYGPGFSYRDLNGSPRWNLQRSPGSNVSAHFSTSFNKHVTMRLAAGHSRTGTSAEELAIPSLPGLANRYNPYDGILTPDQTWALQDDTQPHDEVSNRYVPTNSPYYDPTNLKYTPQSGDHWRKVRTLQNDWVINFELPFTKLQTVTGWSYAHDNRVYRDVEGVMAPYSIFDLENQDQTVTWNTALRNDTADKETTTTGFINQRATLWKDRIAVTGGYLWTERTFDRTRWLPVANATEYHVKQSKGMYMGSVLYRITPQASAYYSYSTNAIAARADGVPIWREGKQNEVGIKSEFFNRRLSLSAAYFEISQTNISVANPDYQSGDRTVPSQILTDQSNHGFEIELQGALTRNLSAIASFSDVKMHDFLGRDVRFVSKNLAGLLFNYRIREGAFAGFSATLGAVYTGEFAGDIPSISVTPLGVVAQPSFYIPSYTLVNAGLNYDRGRYQIRLYIDNLTDKKDYIQYGGARYSDQGLLTGEARLVRVSATVKF